MPHKGKILYNFIISNNTVMRAATKYCIRISKEAIVGRTRLWIPISFLFQLNKKFGNKNKVNI